MDDTDDDDGIDNDDDDTADVISLCLRVTISSSTGDIWAIMDIWSNESSRVWYA